MIYSRSLIPLLCIPLLLTSCFRLQDNPPDRLPSSLVSTEHSQSLQKTGQTVIRIGDRSYIASVLKNTFGASIAGIISSNITSQQALFGGPSDTYRENGDVLAASVPASTSARESLRTQACNLIVQDDTALRYAGMQARGVATSTFMTTEVPTLTDIKVAYDLFSPGRIPSDDLVKSLKTDVVDYSVSTGLVPLESWRFLFLTLCISPHWQVL